MSLNNKFINQPGRGVFHTSGYAKVAQGDSIGATSAESFDRRLRVDRNRRAVGRYGDSMIGRNYMREEVKGALDASNPLKQSEASAAPQVSSRQRFNAGGTTPVRGVSIPKRTFTEPPKRYNPYG